jgi:glycosyltransferase involved in cell wall biosynthesis
VSAAGSGAARRDRPLVLHVTTIDMSLDWLLGPQLAAFAAAGYEVVGASAPGPHVPAIEALGVRHVPLRHSTRAMDPAADLRLFGELRSLFTRLAPDLVHTHNPKPGWLGRPAARLAGVGAVVNTVHGLYALPDDPLAKRAVVYPLERLAAACSHAELVQSAEDLTVLRRLRVPRERLHLLGNGVDLGRFSPDRADPTARSTIRAAWGVGPDEVLLGAVGRLVHEKGLAELVEAARVLRTGSPAARLVVVGPTDDAKGDAVSAADRAAGERAGVIFAGRRDDMVDVYSAFDAYVLASHREGFPRSAMEAAAMALPVVATDIRGCREVVEPGVTGLLVPVRDGRALADALTRLVDDPTGRAAMGVAGRRKALRQFDQRRVIDRTLAVYDRLLAGSGAGVAGR